MTASNTGTSQFYIPETRRTFINKVQAGLSQRKVVVLEGPTGVGKTVLLEEVLTQSLPDANKCYVTPTRGLNDIQVRSRIIEQLFGNVLFDPEMPMLTSFIELSQPQQILIAIDNCQFLSGRVIGELLQLSSEAKNLGLDLTVVLALDKSLNSTLLNVNSKLVKVMPIPLLNRQESYELLVEYIADIPAQTNAKVRRWIDNAAGLPIQLLAYNEQNKASSSLDSEEEVSPLNVKLWGSLLVLASLALAIGVYVYRKGLEQPNTETQPEAIAIEQKPAASSQVVKEWSTEPESEKTKETELEFSLDEKPMAQVIAMPTANSESILADILGENGTKKAPEKAVEAKQVEQNPTTDLILSELTSDKAKLTEEQQREAEAQLFSELQQEEKALAELPETTETEQESKNEPVSLDFFLPEGVKDTALPQQSDEMISEPITPTNLPEDQLESDIVASSTESAVVQPNYPTYFIDNQAFMSLPADRFVLQLTAVSNEAVLTEYLSSAPVPVEELRIYQIKRKQNDWIVVTYGLFETIEQARQAAKRVEPNAWAKSISVIQQQILAFQKAQE